jgi:hypothetical protein
MTAAHIEALAWLRKRRGFHVADSYIQSALNSLFAVRPDLVERERLAPNGKHKFAWRYVGTEP